MASLKRVNKELQDLSSNHTTNVECNHTTNVECNHTTNVECNHTTNVDSNHTTNVDSNHTTNVDSNHTTNVDSNHTTNVDSNHTTNVDSNHTTNVECNHLTNLSVNLTDRFDLNLNEDYQLWVILTRLTTYQLKLFISIEYRTVRRNRQYVENTYFRIPIYLNKTILEYLPDGKIEMEFLINYPDDYPYRGLVWEYSTATYQDKTDFAIEGYCQEMINRHSCQESDHSPADTISKNILNFISVNNHFLDLK